MGELIDLSHAVVEGMVTYPGLPAPSITVHTSREESAARLEGGVSFHIGRIDMVANTGTYLDAPFHFDAEGADLARLPLERLVDRPTVVVRTGGHTAIGPDLLPARTELADAAVLFHTGWSRHWGSEAYFGAAPFLTADCVFSLAAAGPALVGIDSLNIDDRNDGTRPAHSVLLGAGIPIIEHLTALARVPGRGARLTALPAPVKGMGTFPVRVVARIP
ncbi:MAG: cyclase family protein [Acidimicrobiales bacterium]